MEKNLDLWNAEKKRVQQQTVERHYNERDIWWCTLGINIGSEEDGTGKGYQRPVLILRGVSRNSCFITPLSTSQKKHRFRIPIGLLRGRQAVVLISQLRLIDTKRLVDKIGILDQGTFAKIRKPPKTCFNGFPVLPLRGEAEAIVSPLAGRGRSHLHSNKS